MGKPSRRRAPKQQAAKAAQSELLANTPRVEPGADSQALAQTEPSPLPRAPPVKESGITSTHVCALTVVAQVVVLCAIHPNGERDDNHVSVPLWAVLLELGIVAAAILQVCRWLYPPPPRPQPPPTTVGAAAARAAALAAGAAEGIKGVNAELTGDLLQQRLHETGNFSQEQVTKVLPHLMPQLMGPECQQAQTRDDKIAVVVRDVEDEMLRQGATVGLTHLVTLLNLTVYTGKLLLALYRLFAGEWQWEGEDDSFWRVIWDEADVNDAEEKGAALLQSLFMVLVGCSAIPFSWMVRFSIDSRLIYTILVTDLGLFYVQPTIRWHLLGQRAPLRKPLVETPGTAALPAPEEQQQQQLAYS